MTNNLATIKTWQAEIEVEIVEGHKELATANSSLVAAEAALAAAEARREELRGVVASISAAMNPADRLFSGPSRPLPNALRRRLLPLDSEVHNAIGAVTCAGLVVEGIEHRLIDLRQAHAAIADQIALSDPEDADASTTAEAQV